MKNIDFIKSGLTGTAGAFAMLSLTTATWGAAPLIEFVSPGPGINLPFTDDGNVVGYGKHIFGPAGYVWDTWAGWADTPAALARFGPSLENDNANLTPMPIDEDWGLYFTFGLRTSGETSDDVIFFKSATDTPGEQKIFRLTRNANDTVDVRLGAAGGTWSSVVVSADMTEDNWKDFMLHYKADTQRFDLYIDDVLQVADFDMQHGNYALDFVQLQPSGTATVDFYRLIKVGQIVSTALEGDFNGDTVVNSADIDMLCAAIPGGPAETYDLDGDTDVDMDDLDEMVLTILGTNYGDTDTDGDVDLSDLGNLATHYEQAPPRTWGQGDFDCDTDVDLSDLGTLATYYGLGQAQAYADFSALTGVEVPEPALACLALLGPVALIAPRIRRR